MCRIVSLLLLATQIISTLVLVSACQGSITAGKSNLDEQTDFDKMSFEFVLRTKGVGKRGLQWYNGDLTVVNRQVVPMWILFPKWADERLESSMCFPSDADQKQPFGGRQCVGDQGTLVEVVMYGHSGFKAFRLPACGQFTFRGFGLDSDKPITEFEICMVKRLMVNGVTPLEKWLPYPTMSGKKVMISSGDWINLDWDPTKHCARDDYPNEKVENVKADLVGRWLVPIGKEKKK